MNAQFYYLVVCKSGALPIVSERILAFLPEHVTLKWLEKLDGKTQAKWKREWHLNNVKPYPNHPYDIWYVDKKKGKGQILIIKARQLP